MSAKTAAELLGHWLWVDASDAEIARAAAVTADTVSQLRAQRERELDVAGWLELGTELAALLGGGAKPAGAIADALRDAVADAYAERFRTERDLRLRDECLQEDEEVAWTASE